MEKGLVLLLLCCAGALVADSMPIEEQQRVLELLQQELASAKASQYPVAEKQRVGFPTNPVEQQIRNQQIENAVEQGIRHAKEQRTHFPEEQQIRNQQIEQQIRNQQIEQGISNQQIEQGIRNQQYPVAEQGIHNQQYPVAEQGIRNQQYPVAEQGIRNQQYPVAEQGIRNQQIENAVEQGIRNAKEQRTHFPEEQQLRNQQMEQQIRNQQIEQQIRNQQIEQQIRNQQIEQQIRNEQIEEQQIQNAKEQQSTNNGVVYTRWGSTECPTTATRVYNGRAAGAHYTHAGTAANYICLPDNPEYYSSTKKAIYAALVYGAEYETWGSPLANLANHNVPCAVCYAERNAMIMAPAKITCPSQWTREYNGYLMASYYAHASAKTFVCVDIDAQPVRGEAHNTEGALFYHARLSSCYGLDCPPYDTKKDLACVVCTK